MQDSRPFNNKNVSVRLTFSLCPVDFAPKRGFIKNFYRKVFFASFILMLVMGVSLNGWAEKDIRSEVLDGFRKWYGSVDTLYAEFSQTTFNPVWGEDQKAEGEVWFRKPGNMRWEYRSPQKDVIVINDEGLFWYVPEDNQLIKKKKEEAFRTISPMSILGENMEIERDFEILEIKPLEEKTKKDKVKVLGYRIMLKPKEPQVSIKHIGVEVGPDKFQLISIQVEETSGSRNSIEFKELKENKDLEKGLFLFEPLPGTKVITPKDFPSW